MVRLALALKSTLSYSLKLGLPRPRPPSSYSISFQSFQIVNFVLIQRHKESILQNSLVFLIPNAHALFPHPKCLIQFSSCCCFCTFCQPFEELPQRAAYVRDAHFELLLDLIKSSNARSRTLMAAVAHCLAIKVGAVAHLPISTSLLTIYSKAGDFNSSRDLFDEIHNKDVISWNAIIAASVENNCYTTAMDYFDKMIQAGTGFDSTTLLLMVSASLYTNNFEQGRSIHCLSIKTGMLVDTSLGNILTDMYAKFGDPNSSERIFVEMGCKDIVSWNSIMRGCVYNDEPEKSLRHFKEMAFSVEADNVSLSCAISACSALQELSLGQSIHGLGIKLGYDDSSNVSVPNSLISLYSQSGDSASAETVFREMIYRDIVSWNAIMEGFASNGKINEAFSLLLEMQATDTFQPDTVTLITILKLSAELTLSKEGRTVHGFAIRRLMMSDLTLLNSLIDMYSKCSCIENAQLLFNSATQIDLVSWTTMIFGYSRNGYSKVAQNLFRKLLHWLPNCSTSAVVAVLSSCRSQESFYFGKCIHCWQLKSGFLNHVVLINSLMNMYINCGDLITAFSILQDKSALADIASWNTIIVGCVQSEHFQEALETFSVMRRVLNINYDSITLVNVLSACANLELLSEGKSLHGLALKSPLGSDTRVQNSLITMYGRCRDINSARAVFKSCSTPNLCSWNCMISVLLHNKESKEALELFHHIKFKPNEITVVGLLSACTQIGVLTHGKQVHAHVFRSGIQQNSFISAALVDLYSSCGRLDIALKVFKHSEVKSEVAWNSMISAYGYHSNGKKAIELFHEMYDSGTRVTKSTFVSLLSACSHSGLVNEGLKYYNCMLEKYGIQPVTEHQVYVVDMLGRSGRLSEAYEFIMRLHSHSSSGLWGTLLNACNHHGEIKLGKEVAKLLFELEPQNVGYYISLSNMYVAAGSWKDATELRQTIRAQGLRKPAGYSLIIGLG